MALTLLAFFCLIFCCSRATAASKCHRSPIQIPILQDVNFNRDNRSPEPAATITIRTEHRLLYHEFRIEQSEGEGNDKLQLGERNHLQNYDQSMEKDQNGDIVLNFYAKEEFYSLFVISAFDLGCYKISMFFIFSENSNGTFSPINVGRIVEFPPMNMVVKPNEYYHVRYEVETRERIELHPRVLNYRNESGLTDKLYLTGDPGPIEFSRPTPGPGQPRIIDARFRWPEGLNDLLVQVQLSVSDPKLLGKLDFFSVTYLSSLHTNEETESIVQIDPYSFPSRRVDENGGVRLFVKAGRQSCILVLANGNPLPEIAMAEMSGPNTVSRLIHQQLPGPWYDTNVHTNYVSDRLMNAGEVIKYILAIKNGRGQLSFMNVTVEAYQPLSISVTEPTLMVGSPRNVTLQCQVLGPFKSFGFYRSESDNWTNLEDDRDSWRLLQGFPSSENGGNYSYNLVVDQNTFTKLRDHEVRHFCAANGRFKVHVKEFYFNTY